MNFKPVAIGMRATRIASFVGLGSALLAALFFGGFAISGAAQSATSSPVPESDRAEARQHDRRGVILAQSGDLNSAIEQFRTALSQDPNFIEARYHLALAYEQAGRTDDAMEAYQEALRLYPELTEARYRLAACCAKRGDFAGESRLLAEVVAREPGLAEAHYNYGIALRNHDQPREAAEQFRAAAQINPQSAKFLIALGIALAAQNSKEAVEVLRRAVRLDPRNAEAHYNLALALAADGESPDTVREFNAALSLNPNHTSAHRGLAVTLMHQGKFKDAAAELTRTLELAPSDSEAANNLGMVELRMNGTGNAIHWLERAVQLNPQLIKAHFNLAQAYQRGGRPSDARRESQLGASLTQDQRNRGRAMVLLQSAQEAVKAGDKATALARLRDAIAADSGFPEAHLQFGLVLRASGGDPEEAVAAFRRVLRLDPERAEAHYEIGLTLQREGRKPEALDEFRIAVEMAPCRVEARRAFGQAALGAAKWSLAAAQFRSVLAWWPQDKEARDGLERAVTEENRPR